MLKSENYLNETFFVPWFCPKIFIILSIPQLTIASDRQIDNRAIETFQDGPFARFVEVGLLTYPKCFCPNHKRFAGKILKSGGLPMSLTQLTSGHME